MAILVLKLVGYNSLENYIIRLSKLSFNLNDIYTILIEKGMTHKELSDVKFICKGNNINNNFDIVYNLEENEEQLIYIYTSNKLIQFEFIKHIFCKTSSEDDTPEEVDVLTKERIDKINTDIIKSFQDPDFVNLLRICINKPALLNQVSSYLMNGNIIIQNSDIQNLDIQNLENFQYQDIYDELISIFAKINYENYTEQIVKSVLIHFNGHLNLSLRYILNLSQS